MRIIAGTYRSRLLAAPKGLATRPTSDRLRETLFNVLAPRIRGARFLDLYAGSGAVGIEALSRGAAQVVWVERAAPALKVLGANLEKLGLRGRARVHAGGVAAFLRRSEEEFDIVFLDPPYDAPGEYEDTLGWLGQSESDPASQKRKLGRSLAEGAVVVAEHRRNEPLADRYGALIHTRLLEQGDAWLSFYAL